MATNTGFTSSYGIQFPVVNDVQKAVIVSKALERVDFILMEFYSASGLLSEFLWGSGQVVQFGSGRGVGL